MLWAQGGGLGTNPSGPEVPTAPVKGQSDLSLAVNTLDIGAFTPTPATCTQMLREPDCALSRPYTPTPHTTQPPAPADAHTALCTAPTHS